MRDSKGYVATRLSRLCNMFSEKRLNVNWSLKTLTINKIDSSGTIKRLLGRSRPRRINVQSCTSVADHTCTW